MEIYTKLMPGGPTVTGIVPRIWQTLDRIFTYAAEVLGENYKYTEYETGTASHHSDFVFIDPAGSGEYGWRIWESEDKYVPTIMFPGDQHTSFDTIKRICVELSDFTAMVWKTSDGSVGIGYRDANGSYQTCLLLIKFNGKYDNTDVYGIACNYGATGFGPIIVHGHSDITQVNHCHHSEIGSGVYLHPLFDPVSGLVSTDVFGVQSMGSAGYAHNGTIIKQGGISYMSVLCGTGPGMTNTSNALFVKM